MNPFQGLVDEVMKDMQAGKRKWLLRVNGWVIAVGEFDDIANAAEVIQSLTHAVEVDTADGMPRVETCEKAISVESCEVV
jgi:hypothetical protein